jgi:hypothetical protein
MIANSHTISTAENGAVIYARKNPTNACLKPVLSLCELLIVQQLVLFPATTLCTRNASEAPLKADFNLTAPINAVLGSQDRSYNILTFHSTEDGAKTTLLL